MRIYHTGRALAILVGVAAAGGALTILLADPYVNGNWRLDHILLPLIVTITIASGHLFGKAIRAWKFLSALGFALTFAVGTLLTVYSSVGAQKSGASARQEVAIEDHNLTLEEKRAELARARKRFEDANTMADREMDGQRCLGKCNDWKTRAKEVAARIALLEREIRGIGPHMVAPSRARPFAAALGELGIDKARAERIAATFEPFIFSLLFELSAIVAFGYGFSHGRPLPQAAPARTPPKKLSTTPAPQPPPFGRRGRKADPNVVDFVVSYRDKHGCDPTGTEVMSAFPGIAKSTAYDAARRKA